MEAEAPTVQVGTTPTGLTAPRPPQPLQGFFTGQMPFLPPNQQRQALEAINYNFCLLTEHYQQAKITFS